jgi:hypothetical protein
MTPLESQPDPPKLDRRRYQFSLRSIFALTTGTAAFFALGRTLGYADAFVILIGVVITVGVMEWPRRVCVASGILLTLVAGTLLWANLRITGWQKQFRMLPPDHLDRVAKSMFYRGWPWSPCVTCLVHGMRFDASEAGVYVTFVFDGIVSSAALCLVRWVCEFCCRRPGKPIIEILPETQPPSSDLSPAVSTSEPRRE